VVIRPLLYVAEPLIAEFASHMQFPILPCDLCGPQDNLMRKQVKELLRTLERTAPKVKDSMLAALGNVRASHLLDRELWQKLGLAAAASSDPLAEELDPLPARPGRLRVLP
jgi:tRNA 2-thiocytidine biosynthesis protein TtcA